VSAAEAAFAAIAEDLLHEPAVSEGTGFGSNAGLRAAGKIFAMLVRGELVVKLSAARCAELVASGSARPFDRGRGHPLREWICVGEAEQSEWPALAREALAFVAG
jgi:TfoX/Sxy family transcriptional regulator of competence genes